MFPVSLAVTHIHEITNSRTHELKFSLALAFFASVLLFFLSSSALLLCFPCFAASALLLRFASTVILFLAFIHLQLRKSLLHPHHVLPTRRTLLRLRMPLLQALH
ncbi:uncharacterized protein BDV17DRAFT_258851 [Aspergillus undulatus]|uniref:uncharacterized protein n=1 Tax=Aspergillus undulatus TaxID=1810928 RepID=UPI003CCD558B